MKLKAIVSVFVICFLCGYGSPIGCARQDIDPDFLADQIKMAEASGKYSGVWLLKLNVKKDTCKLGFKSASGGATIVQNGKRASIRLHGIGTYKGKIKKNKLVGKGKEKFSSLAITTTVKGRFRSTKKMSITKAKIKVKNTSGGASCSINFKGSGSRVS